MATPRVMVVKEHATNCEEESCHAFFKLAGAPADIVHMNDWMKQPSKIEDYQILCFPGGFSYGDQTGSARAWANRLEGLKDPIQRFLEKEYLALGICNGFQAMVNLGMLPALNNQQVVQAALVHNELPRYTCRWVDLQIEGKSPWLEGIERLTVPIAHGEGKFVAEPGVLEKLNANRQIAARYVRGEICQHLDLPVNPNGSLEDIAGIMDSTGRVLGLMPHPERAMDFTQLPHWPLLAEGHKRRGESLPTEGPGLQIFKNAVNYFKEG